MPDIDPRISRSAHLASLVDRKRELEAVRQEEHRIQVQAVRFAFWLSFSSLFLSILAMCVIAFFLSRYWDWLLVTSH